MILVAMATAAPVALAAEGAPTAACEPGVVEIRSPTGARARFHVEIADDDAERARGLMNRPNLPASAGMLFVYPAPGPVSFWMKNTLIPLDMIFVDARGVVRRVHENARPHDTTAIPGGEDILAVLEIRGGLARRLGIGPGSEMRHPAFPPALAAWSCAG